jgi:hypothetical protein
MRTYTLNLSTNSQINKSTANLANLASVSWKVNWKEIFGNRTGACRVRAKFQTQSQALAYAYTFGTLRCNLSSASSSCSNGLVLGQLSIFNDQASGTNYKLICDTTMMTNGVSMIIPNTNSDLTITLLDDTENTFIGTVAGNTFNITSYLLTLYFDVDEDEPTLKMDAPRFNLAR